jgi:hypothetical protein
MRPSTVAVQKVTFRVAKPVPMHRARSAVCFCGVHAFSTKFWTRFVTKSRWQDYKFETLTSNSTIPATMLAIGSRSFFCCTLEGNPSPVVVPPPRLPPTTEARFPEGTGRTPEVVPHPALRHPVCGPELEPRPDFCNIFRAESESGLGSGIRETRSFRFFASCCRWGSFCKGVILITRCPPRARRTPAAIHGY